MRLIDADALIATLRESKYMIYYANATLPIIQNNEIERCISFVETAPTIKTFTLADIEEQYRKGLEKGLEKWEYLKEHITDMRDADGESYLNQKQICQFILNLMGVIEEEGDKNG